ncbi:MULTISPECIES: hypothetical protein [Flavobacterium]|uniref:DUF4340 domain-containing protein n=1 Tax=Flavobacterium jumunjinense TaxID=998845 RepID=A0ABV5GP59_9FLAO|nr:MULTISPECIES: hypothetical protein [Flavobacterium]
MRKSKIYKILGVIFLIGAIGGGIFYSQLSKRKKAIVKTTLLHKIGIVDSEWQIANSSTKHKMMSPTFLVDGIYKSMEGPQSSRYIQLSQEDSLLWITGFDIKAIDATTSVRLSNDFICHMNVDINDVNYYTHWDLKERIGKQFPRLTSLSNGFITSNFPDGYGVPIKGNDFLYITSQVLNHNQASIFKKLKHEVTITHEPYNGKQRPLMSKTVFIQLPYNAENPYKSPLSPGSNQCIPVDPKYHSYTDAMGQSLSGHWVVPQGKNTYRSSIKNQLQLKDSLRLHYSAIHVHPFATSIALHDKTSETTLFKSAITNFKKKIGLQKVTPFSSIEGIWLYADHDYELVLEVDNTSATDQDMMGSMFLFFYDSELEEKIKLSLK